jgi:hypothetical protein
MKKVLFSCLVGLLALAVAGTVYAQPKLEFKATGRFDAEWVSGKNIPASQTVAPSAVMGPPPNYGFAPGPTGRGGGFNNSNSFQNSRGTLIFDAKMGNEVSGTVIFEIDAIRWGDTPGGQIGKISERNTTGFWGGDRASVEVKNVYLDFSIPAIPVPTTVRMGEQPLAIRPNFFLYTDGPGVTVGIKVDPVTVAPFWFKAVEGSDWSADDVDIYGLQLRGNIGKLTLGGYGVYYNMNTYPFFASTAIGTLGTTPQLALSLGTMRADMWWLGAYMDGRAGPLNVNIDILVNTGEVESRRSAVQDVDYEGWRIRGKVDYPWERFNFGFIGAYGSGADAKKTSNQGLPGQAAANGGLQTRKVSTSVVPPGSESGIMSGESLIFYASPVVRYTGWSANQTNFSMTPGSIGGSWFAKLYSTYKVAQDFKVTLQGLYIGDTTKNGNTIGTAVKPGTNTPRDDSDIGWEFDLITELQIYKSLTWQAGAGYLFMGDAMDFNAGGGFSKSPNNAWTVQSRVMYVF